MQLERLCYEWRKKRLKGRGETVGEGVIATCCATDDTGGTMERGA
jgi:hypothetical protein